MFFNSKKISHYVIVLSIIFVVSSIGDKLKSKLNNNDDYEMIKKYILNESPLYGYNRPKLWIHTKYNINSRNWKENHFRNSTDLNIEYLHLTIKSIINHCGQDFNICLIDDNSFNKLIPSWDINISELSEPIKEQYRELGMLQIIYYYGGFIVPNSFICLKNLKPLYDDNISKPFVCEKINKTCDISNTNNKLFITDIYFMGSNKDNSTLLELIEKIKIRNRKYHLTHETKFKGEISNECNKFCNINRFDTIGGEYIGIKTKEGKPILLDNLMEESYLEFDENMYGIYIPEDEILKRKKYEWFIDASAKQILDSNNMIAKYLKLSIIEANNEYNITTKKNSITTI